MSKDDIKAKKLADLFYNDSAFLAQESDVMHAVVTSSGHLNNESKRHVKRGFDRRLGMLESSRIFLRENCEVGRDTPNPYLLDTIQLHLNSYYVNLHGALDNLGWALHYHFSLFADIDEQAGKNTNRINLFDRRFRNALAAHAPSLSNFLKNKGDWSRQLARWRHPAAHRIPLYVPPGILTEEQAEEFKRLEDLAGMDDEARKGERRVAILERAHGLGTFCPWFICEDKAGTLEVYALPVRIAEDHATFLEISVTTIAALGLEMPPPRPTPVALLRSMLTRPE